MKRSEPEIDERTDAACVQGTKAENESQDADNEGDNVLFFPIFGEIDLVLHPQAEL